MEWIETSQHRPPYGEWIWIWDMDKQEKRLVKYLGSEEDYQEFKLCSDFPIWAYLNEE